MDATPIRLSPHWTPERGERLIRHHLARRQAVVLSVSTTDVWRMRQLRRLWHRFLGDPSLIVSTGKHEDGTGTLLIAPADAKWINWGDWF